MQLRNAAYNRFGTIDCEIEHPVHGWIPFTADPNDVEELGRTVYAAASLGQVAKYVAPVPAVIIPSRVSARQFKMQLEIAGLTASVATWVAGQEKPVQIAYANSGSFVRDEPKLQEGFAAIGLTKDEVGAFFTAAAAL